MPRTPRAQPCSAQGESHAVPAHHILVAEDDPDIRANLARLLRLEGYRVVTAADGAAAMAAIQAERPDLLVSDLMMPGIDGLQLLAWLRADLRTARLPVVLLTARADDGDVQGGRSAGADAYVTKPYQREELLRHLRVLLAGSGAP